VPRLVAVSLYHMLLEAKASEHSARMVAMKNASDKSKEVAHDLTRLYNKIRQAAITREVSGDRERPRGISRIYLLLVNLFKCV
jgi:F-type H+-transporting ATPase subunit gamma